MNKNLINALTPLNKQGHLDQRFRESIGRVIEDIGEDSAHVLSDFYIKTSELQRSAARAGLDLVEALYREADRLSNNRRTTENEYNWMGKSLRKSTAEILHRLGFKEKNASKILNAAEFKSSLRVHTVWINSLSVSHLYELSRMNEQGFQLAVKEASTENTNLVGVQNPIPANDWRDVSVRRFEEIRRFNPKKLKNLGEDFSSGSDLKIHDDEPTPITEVVLERSKEDMCQLELVDELVQLVSYLDFERIYKDKEIIERLNIVSEDLWALGHLAQHPVPTN